MDKIEVKFPQGEIVELKYGKPIILLGANGAGKTRFSVKVEELNDLKFSNWHVKETTFIHRISAQKSLTIDESILILDIESSQKKLYYGDSSEYAYKESSRYRSHPATFLLDDYASALSLLFSESNKELQEAHDKDLQAIREGIERPEPIKTVVEKATEIWNDLLPHRKIDLTGNGVHVNYGGERYHGKEMSDGERVMLYMICQILVQRPNSLLIIDEPELHIHKSVVDKLWTRLESERPDCVFMYITHDLSFAMSRNNADVLWIKSFDGNVWEYEFLDVDDYTELPSELLFEIVGTRQKILFVEGTRNSYDHQLYQEIYKNAGYHVIPCGSCHEVIRHVKAKQAYEKLNAITVVGIIDRDFRSDYELEALQRDGIYSLKVAEVENLFVLPEILEVVERELACEEGTAQKAKDFITFLFNQNKELQINLSLRQELYHKLSVFDVGKGKLTPEEINSKLITEFSIGKITDLLTENQNKFNNVRTISEILKVFNFKELSLKMGEKFGLSKRDYPRRVLNLIRRQKGAVKEEIISALKSYCPELP